MKRTELFFSVVLVPIDFAFLVLSAWLAYRLRFQAFITELRPVLYDLSPLTYLRSAVFVALAWVAVFAVLGLYRRRSTDPWWPEVGRVIIGCSVGFVVVVLFVFFRHELLSSRFIILAAWAIAIALVTLGRLIIRLLQRLLFRYGVGAHRVVIVGHNDIAQAVAHDIQAHPEFGYALAGKLPISSESVVALEHLLQTEPVDEVLYIDPVSQPGSRQLFLEAAEYYHKTFRYAPDVLQSSIGRLVINIDLGIPIIEVPETTLTGWARVVKRAIDIVGSAAALLTVWPLLLFLSWLVRIDSPGPSIYTHVRIGRGRKFVLYKFRTMKIEHCVGEQYGGAVAEDLYRRLVRAQSYRQGPVPKIVNDPRLTRVGEWLRRFSLDELPQFWNILKGDMSLVGPRPHYPSEVARYAKHHRKVLAVKPGLTGLAQVNGRADLDFDDEVRLDRYYIEHWSLWLDLRILLRTIVTIFERHETL